MMERELALEVLIAYEKEKSYLNITLNHVLDHADLDRQGKNLVTALVYGTIQYRILLEYQLEPFVEGKHIKVYERMLLLMSMYQHMFMHMPDYAVVNEAVEMAKKKRGKKAGSFVNAVLKNSFKAQRSLEGLNEEERLSIETSHPLWMVKLFIHQYGLEIAKKIMSADNDVPLRTGRINTLKISREDLLHSDPHFQEGELSPDALYYEGGNIAHTQAYKEGYLTIQDESSQMVARLLAPLPGQIVLDMCGAPGSKTTHLAALMENKGEIDVFDLYEHKIALINNNCQRLGVKIVHAKAGDASLIETFGKRTYDRILLDGPCSGLGVLARKPEIKYHDSTVMDEIIPLQQKLLENAYALCKNSGKIVYSTCTINKKENEKQIEAFIKKHPDMKVIEEKTILPYEYHSDGFFMCLMEKDSQ